MASYVPRCNRIRTDPVGPGCIAWRSTEFLACTRKLLQCPSAVRGEAFHSRFRFAFRKLAVQVLNGGEKCCSGKPFRELAVPLASTTECRRIEWHRYRERFIILRVLYCSRQ